MIHFLCVAVGDKSGSDSINSLIYHWMSKTSGMCGALVLGEIQPLYSFP